MTLTPIQLALVQRARDDGRPLHPEDPDDVAVLLRAEMFVRRGSSGGQALELARSQPTSIADLRGIVRHARARHEHDRLAPLLDERGLTLQDLTPKQLVSAANWLYRIPADPLVAINVEDILEAFPGSYEVDDRVQDDGPEFGRVVGACARCSSVIRSRQSTAVYYDRVHPPEWRVIVPAENVTRVTSQAFAFGAPALCSACTVRMRQKLIVWKDGAFHHVINEDDVTPIDVSGDRDCEQPDVEPVADPVELDEHDDTLTFEELMGE